MPKRDPRIKEYEKKGEKFYRFQVYVGYVGEKSKYVKRSGFKTPREARLALAEIESDRTDFLRNNGKLKFQKVYDMWFKQYAKGVKESTAVKTSDLFRLHILPKLGDTPIEKINPTMLQDAVNDWFDSGLSKYQVFLNYASNVFEFAYKLNMIADNPAKKVFVPTDKESKQTREEKSHNNFYEKDELLEFLDAVDHFKNPRAYVLFNLLAATGMRRGEALALTWDDIDFDKHTVDINKTLSQGEKYELIVQVPKTRNSKRTLFLDDATMDMLAKWQFMQKELFDQKGIKVKKENQLLLSNDKNEFLQLSYPQKWLDWILKAHNKNMPDNQKLKRITVHGLRHTFATLAAEAGVQPKALQEQLGHANFQTTMNIYAAVSSKNKKDVTSKLTEFLRG